MNQIKTVAFGVIIILILSSCGASRTPDYRRARAAGIPIVVTGMSVTRPNYAGGVGVNIGFVNSSHKVLKYVRFRVRPYNRVGDSVSSEIGQKSIATLQAVGPYKPAYGDGSAYWKNVWYNQAITCMKLEEVELIYMEGGSEVYKGKDLRKVLASYIRNRCLPR